MQRNEEGHIHALRAKSPQAFGQLVEHYQERVLNTCLGFLPVRQDAEDVMQEVFIEIWRSADQFRGESSLSTWIYRIAVTKSLETLRYRKRAKRVAFFRSIIGLDTAAALSVADDGFDHPGIQLENRERAKVLFDHIGQLPEKQRAAFILQKVEGMRQQEIAAVMNISESAVESLLFRAKEQLQKKLSSYYKDQ